MKKYIIFIISLSGMTHMEMWQSWFNAPDLKSDEGASPPGVRIPTSPPIKESPTLCRAFFVDEGC